MERMAWIKKMYEKYLNDINMECTVDRVSRTVEVCKRISKYVKKISKSYCDPSDTFDRETGIAIAYARLIGEYIPDYVLQNKMLVKDVKIGGMFILKSNHKTYVKVCEHPSYYNEYRCTFIENGEIVIISDDSEVEKIF